MFKKSLGIIALVSSFASMHGAEVAPVMQPQRATRVESDATPLFSAAELYSDTELKIHDAYSRCKFAYGNLNSDECKAELLKFGYGILFLRRHASDFRSYYIPASDQHPKSYDFFCNALTVLYHRLLRLWRDLDAADSLALLDVASTLTLMASYQ